MATSPTPNSTNIPSATFTASTTITNATSTNYELLSYTVLLPLMLL